MDIKSSMKKTVSVASLESASVPRDGIRFAKVLKERSSLDWKKQGERFALNLFHAMAERVPAYVDMLKKHKIRAESITTIADFQELPLLDKENYLRAYPRSALCWDGAFPEKAWTICATSGSTGEPFYFPHTLAQDAQYACIAEVYLRTNFQIHTKRTLYINGFPMGMWIGGVFTYKAISMIAERGNYALSIINPGLHKEEIIRAVLKLGGEFDQVIIGSYGPFLKDILDDGIREGVDWKKYNLGFIFSAEGFSEKFRDYVLAIAGKKDDLLATLNHYGTVDLGTMAYETPLAILARRLALKRSVVYRELFDDSIRLPTLAQYVPSLFYFEEVSRILVCSAASGLPLVRYNLKDVGGVYTHTELAHRFENRGVYLTTELASRGLDHTHWNLPFVYVYERDDFSVSFYAFQIYPTTVRRALEQSVLHTKVTGKFSMRVVYDKNKNQQFEVHIELKKGGIPNKSLAEEISQHVLRQLLKESTEYRETFREKSHRIAPRVVLWVYEHEQFFRPGIKQKWVLKDR